MKSTGRIYEPGKRLFGSLGSHGGDFFCRYTSTEFCSANDVDADGHTALKEIDHHVCLLMRM